MEQTKYAVVAWIWDGSEYEPHIIARRKQETKARDIYNCFPLSSDIPRVDLVGLRENEYGCIVETEHISTRD